MRRRPAGTFTLDVLTAYTPRSSPSTPEQYVQTLARQYPIGPASDGQPRPVLAIVDYGLHSAVKTAVACEHAGVDHIVGFGVRIVPERGYRTWGERAGELILLAMDESGWLSLGVKWNLCFRVNNSLERGHDRGSVGPLPDRRI